MRPLSLVLMTFLFTLVSCGPAIMKDSVVSVASREDLNIDYQRTCDECEVYREEFEGDLQTSTNYIPIIFQELETGKAGICYQYKGGGAIAITIDPEVWGNLTPAGRKILVFHELGHCVLGLDHVDVRLQVKESGEDSKRFMSVQGSIMSAYLPAVYSASFLLLYWDEYVEALRDGRSVNMDTDIDFSDVDRMHFLDVAQTIKFESSRGIQVAMSPKLNKSVLCVDGKYLVSNERYLSLDFDKFDCLP